MAAALSGITKALGPVDKFGSQILAAARARKAEKDFRALSYRVAMRRTCLKRFRSLQARKSQAGSFFRFAFGGVTGLFLWIRAYSRGK